MLHAGTPKTSKPHILKSVSVSEGLVRVLICTVAFGMRIDMKAARKVIHFGPSHNVEECYLRECAVELAGMELKAFVYCCTMVC